MISKLTALYRKLELIFDNRIMCCLLWLVASAVLFIWATITPPFQSPDEIAHFYKAQSILLDPWIADENTARVSHKIENPLVYAEGLGKLPFKPSNQLTSSEVLGLRDFRWLERGDASPGYTVYHSTAAQYPPFYYTLVVRLSEPLRQIFNLAPYESFYVYRYITCFLAILFWTIAAIRLKALLNRPGLAWSLTAIMILVPTNAFISASVNPDSILNPLSAWLFIELYRSIVKSELKSQLLSALLACTILLTKPSAVFVLIAFAAVCMLLMFFTRNWKSGFSTALLVTTGAAAGYFSFYPHLAANFIGTKTPMLLGEYLNNFFDTRLTYLKHQFWGQFGWLDFGLSEDTFNKLELLLQLNFIAALFCCRSFRLVYSAILSFFSMCAVLLLMEYYLLTNSDIGPMLQGRYAFTALIGIAMVTYHRIYPLRWAFLLMLCYANFQGYQESFSRYYADDNFKLSAALPFTSRSIEELRNRQVPERILHVNQNHRWDFQNLDIGGIEAVRKKDSHLEIIGWSLASESVSPEIFIEMPVTPVNSSTERTERGDVRKKFGSAYGFSGFTIRLEFSSPEKAEIARSTFCIAESEDGVLKGISASSRYGSCKSAWKPDKQN